MKKYKCSVCDYIYDEAKGEPDHGIPEMTEWKDLPEDYACPLCGLGREAFALYEETTTIKAQTKRSSVYSMDDGNRRTSFFAAAVRFFADSRVQFFKADVF